MDTHRLRGRWSDRWSHICVIAMVAMAVSACVVSRHPAGIASETVPLTSEYTVLGSAEASSCRNVLLGIPLSGLRSTQEIIDQLVKEKGADALVGLTVEYTNESFSIPIVGASCLNIKGLAVRGGK